MFLFLLKGKRDDNSLKENKHNKHDNNKRKLEDKEDVNEESNVKSKKLIKTLSVPLKSAAINHPPISPAATNTTNTNSRSAGKKKRGRNDDSISAHNGSTDIITVEKPNKKHKASDKKAKLYPKPMQPQQESKKGGSKLASPSTEKMLPATTSNWGGFKRYRAKKRGAKN